MVRGLVLISQAAGQGNGASCLFCRRPGGGSLGTRASIPPALCLLTGSLGPFVSLSLTPCRCADPRGSHASLTKPLICELPSPPSSTFSPHVSKPQAGDSCSWEPVKGSHLPRPQGQLPQKPSLGSGARETQDLLL